MATQITEREVRRAEAQQAARHALAVDMLKSFAAPVVLAAFINPLLQAGRLERLNYGLLFLGLVMIGLALIFVPPKE